MFSYNLLILFLISFQAKNVPKKIPLENKMFQIRACHIVDFDLILERNYTQKTNYELLITN